MAVFRKFLSATKNKMKTPNIKYGRDGAAAAAGGSSSMDNGLDMNCSVEDEKFASRKQKWQEDLDQMSEFLVLKSTEEQREEGVVEPVDTAYVEDHDGMPVLKAVFDVHHFQPDDINLNVENGQLTLEASCVDDRDDAVFRKTMVRKMDLPEFVDPKMMHCDLKDGILTIEMPFHLPTQRKPDGPNVVPIITGEDGRRRIRLAFMLGPDFTIDDVQVDITGKLLKICAAYNTEVGRYGTQVHARELNRQYSLPDYVEVDIVNHSLSPEGRLYIEIILKKDKTYKCEVTTEEVAS